MQSIKSIVLTSMLSILTVQAFAGGCCSQMSGVSYCDSSAGRLVCKNGFYSSCYCTRHAVMDLQLLKGCCLWRGGVMANTNASGLVVCNDGSVSEECSLENPQQSIATW